MPRSRTINRQWRTSFSAAVSGKGARAVAAADGEGEIDIWKVEPNPIEKQSCRKGENTLRKKRKLLTFYSLWYAF